MAKDPAFLFYPGDYLRDTQCLSEKAQVAYDRIMCEHMRNICKDVSNIGITKDKLKFFTKRLNEDELNDLMNVLVKSGDIFQIEWVALSICKRKAYSEGRAENRKGKKNKDMFTYDSHMENENENENVLVKLNAEKNGKSGIKFSGNFKAQGEELLAQRYARGQAEVNGRGKENNQK